MKTDAQLVNEARRGSADARGELVTRYHGQIALLAAALVNDRTEAEDLCQEAFIRAFRNLDLLADPARFGAWIRRIAVGVSIDWLRSFRPDLYRGWDGTEEHLGASRDLSPLEHLLQSEMVTRVGAALDALPPRYRVPIRLYHLDGLSHAKIGLALGLPVPTVRSLVARARKKLGPLLAEYKSQGEQEIDDVFEEPPVAASRKTQFLHVANGTCTINIIESAGIPGARSIWADPLYEGPVPAVTDEELIDVRSRYLLGPSKDVHVEPVNDMRRWRSLIAAHETYDELVLWFEHDLFDQLNLVQILSWLPSRVPGTKAVSLVCVGSFPGHPAFKGLGQLSPDELASLFVTRRRIDGSEYSLAERTWQAFREVTPETLDDLRHRDMNALPFLAAALKRFLEEYPWTADGLSRTERRLLRLADPGPVDIRAAFPRMHDGEDVYYITDSSFADLAETLSQTSPPLLRITHDETVHATGLSVTMQLTNAGKDVLTGVRDRVSCGIDRWLGGVHLHSAGDDWRWDQGQQRITKQ